MEILRGDANAALAAAEQGPKGPWQDVGLALARQIGSDRAAADAALKLVIEKYSDGAPYQIAEIYAFRKDANNTFLWLDKAWAARDPGIQFLLLIRCCDRTRPTALRRLCRKAGLPMVEGEGNDGGDVLRRGDTASP